MYRQRGKERIISDQTVYCVHTLFLHFGARNKHTQQLCHLSRRILHERKDSCLLLQYDNSLGPLFTNCAYLVDEPCKFYVPYPFVVHSMQCTTHLPHTNLTTQGLAFSSSLRNHILPQTRARNLCSPIVSISSAVHPLFSWEHTFRGR